MSDLYLVSGNTAQPKPDVSQGGGPDFGTYGTSLEMLPVSSPTSLRTFQTYALGSASGFFVGQGVGWISAPLAAHNLNGAWSASLYVSINFDPAPALARFYSALYRWGAGDSLAAQIGSTVYEATSLTSSSPTLFTHTYSGSASITFSEGDRLYFEIWPEIFDDMLASNLATWRLHRTTGSLSKVVTPGTLQFLQKCPPLGLMGVGG
jgi:hypothetical protein